MPGKLLLPTIALAAAISMAACGAAVGTHSRIDSQASVRAEEAARRAEIAAAAAQEAAQRADEAARRLQQRSTAP